jgi:hypothetical protein
MLLIYIVALVTWGWMAGQAARVPVLSQEISALRADAERLDTLSAALRELQARYDQVQRMLSVATAQQARAEAVDSTARTPAALGLGRR